MCCRRSLAVGGIFEQTEPDAGGAANDRTPGGPGEQILGSTGVDQKQRASGDAHHTAEARAVAGVSQYDPARARWRFAQIDDAQREADAHACEGAAGSFYCRSAFEPLPAGTYTFKVVFAGTTPQLANVVLTVRW